MADGQFCQMRWPLRIGSYTVSFYVIGPFLGRSRNGFGQRRRRGKLPLATNKLMLRRKNANAADLLRRFHGWGGKFKAGARREVESIGTAS